jgi:hypothetical protein
MNDLVERVKPLLVEAAKAAVTAGVAYLAAHWSAVNLPDDVKAIVALVAVALWNRFVVKKAA